MLSVVIRNSYSVIALERAVTQNAVMAKKKKDADRHKPGRIVRLPQALADELARLAEENVTNLTQETIRAVREYLARQQRWPPPKGP